MGFIAELKADPGSFHVIAEIGHNHQGDVEKCMRLFDAAKLAGASSVKLQKRDNRALYTPEAYDASYNSLNAFGSTYGEHREALEFGKAEYVALKQYAESIGIVFWSTAFDLASVDFLVDVGIAAIKIASGDLRSHFLLEYASSTGLPIVFSTGGGTMKQIEAAHNIVAANTSELAILQCTAAYPAPYETLNLNVITAIADRFPDAVPGYSGHENGIAMSNVAYVLGARVIEKHFTLDRTWKGTDHAFSLEPEGMRKLVRDLTRTRIAFGSADKAQLEVEAPALVKMGKKAIATRDLAPGDVVEPDDVEFRSPGDGIGPDEVSLIIGGRLRTSVARYAAFHLEQFDGGASA
jgi:N-acetylneuraminate synthase/sialic acid synthase